MFLVMLVEIPSVTFMWLNLNQPLTSACEGEDYCEAVFPVGRCLLIDLELGSKSVFGIWILLASRSATRKLGDSELAFVLCHAGGFGNMYISPASHPPSPPLSLISSNPGPLQFPPH